MLTQFHTTALTHRNCKSMMVSCVSGMACHVMELILNMLFAFAMALSEHHYFHELIQYDANASSWYTYWIHNYHSFIKCACIYKNLSTSRCIMAWIHLVVKPTINKSQDARNKTQCVFDVSYDGQTRSGTSHFLNFPALFSHRESSLLENN